MTGACGISAIGWCRSTGSRPALENWAGNRAIQSALSVSSWAVGAAGILFLMKHCGWPRGSKDTGQSREICRGGRAASGQVLATELLSCELSSGGVLRGTPLWPGCVRIPLLVCPVALSPPEGKVTVGREGTVHPSRRAGGIGRLTCHARECTKARPRSSDKGGADLTHSTLCWQPGKS